MRWYPPPDASASVQAPGWGAPGYPQPMRIRRSVLLAFAAVGLVGGPAVGRADEGSLHARTRTWKSVAETRDAGGLARLVEAYDRPGEIENGRALIVSIACDVFGRAEDLPILSVWRATHPKYADAWLWYRTLVRQAELGQAEAVLALARSGAEAWQRAAALQALAAVAEPESLALVAAAPAALPAPPADRAFVLEALADVWAAQPGRLGTAPYRAAGLWLVEQLEKPETPERTRLAIVRALTRVLRPPIPFEEPAFWRDLLGAEGAPPPVEDRYAPPPGATFLELTGTGKRVAYVIDFSTSMQAPLTDVEREDLKDKLVPKGGPVTGKPGAGGKGGKRPPGPDGLDPDALRGIPWDTIQTRADAAVAFLLVSLRMLPKDAHYCVSVFGTDHAFLRSTPGLVPAVKKNVDATAEELTPPVLRGATNLHGGVARGLRALDRAAPKKMKPGDELLHGATTVFVLSDGAPCADDWGAGAMGSGTYSDTEQLVDDVERLNLFRRCEIHCIGIGDPFAGIGAGVPPGAGLGEGFGTVLRRIAQVGHGRYRAVPSPKPAEAPPAPSKEGPPKFTTPLEYVLNKLRTGAPATERVDAARQLIVRGEVEAVPALLEALIDSDADVRAAVTEALVALTGRIGVAPYPTRSWEQLRERRNWGWWWEQNGARVRARPR